jgi:hypothetical protein
MGSDGSEPVLRCRIGHDLEVEKPIGSPTYQGRDLPGGIKKSPDSVSGADEVSDENELSRPTLAQVLHTWVHAKDVRLPILKIRDELRNDSFAADSRFLLAIRVRRSQGNPIGAAYAPTGPLVECVR